MKVCLVGHYPAQDDNRGDLGTKHVGLQIARRVSERHSTIQIDIKEPLAWKQAKIFQPQLIHFILSPSLWGLVAAKLFAFYCGDTRTVLSAPNPNLPLWRLGALARPDLVLVQSQETERMFTRMGCETRFLPNGVDADRFLPASPTTKVELREKHGLGGDRFIILHVGPIIKRRDIEFLAELQNADRQVLIIGRMPADRHVHQVLLDAGCKVVTDYVEQIEEVYALSDCYVFPTPLANREASIEMPLSVLEAMSCNLPIVTTRFGALPRVFEEGDGLVFVDSEDAIIRELDRVRKGEETRTRDKVLPYAWDNVMNSLHGIYEEISHRTDT